MTEFGYLLPTFEAGDMVDLGVRAEQAGFDAVWVPDSPFVYGLPDPVVVLAGLASATQRVTLGTGVLLAALRQPVLLAHTLASLDQLSGGRLHVGLGYGFKAPETERQFAAAGVPFDGRIGRLTEMITVLRALWSGKPVSHAGKHIAFDEMTLSPARPPRRRSGCRVRSRAPTAGRGSWPTAGCRTCRRLRSTRRPGAASRQKAAR